MMENKRLYLGKVIYKILSEDINIKAKLKNRIYPIISKSTANNVVYPMITFQRNNTLITYSKDGSVKDTVTINIEVFSQDYTESIELAQYVRNALESKGGEIDEVKIDYIRLENITEEFNIDYEVYNQVLTFSIDVY